MKIWCQVLTLDTKSRFYYPIVVGRPLRIEYPGALYHITSRGNERKKIFLEDADKIKFLEILEDYHSRFNILIHSYVLMDNHYHFIVETPKGNLTKVMHGVNGWYTGYFNRKYRRSGHLFQGRYKGIFVDKDAYLVQLSRYIHLNPVRAEIVERPEQYRWSSYSGYIGKNRECTWVEYSWILSAFGSDLKTAKKKYQQYTEEGLDTDIGNPTKDLYGQIILGGEEFIEKIKGMLKGKPLSSEIIERKRLTGNPQPGDVIKIVAEMFGVDEKEINCKGSRANTARKAAIYFMQRYAGLGNAEVGELFGGLHYSAVSKASARLREDIAKDKKLSKIIQRIDSHFKT
jgi:putative transposase